MRFKSTSGSMVGMKPGTTVLAGLLEKVQQGFIFCLFNIQNWIEAYIYKIQVPISRFQEKAKEKLHFEIWERNDLFT